MPDTRSLKSQVYHRNRGSRERRSRGGGREGGGGCNTIHLVPFPTGKNSEMSTVQWRRSNSYLSTQTQTVRLRLSVKSSCIWEDVVLTAPPGVQTLKTESYSYCFAIVSSSLVQFMELLLKEDGGISLVKQSHHFWQNSWSCSIPAIFTLKHTGSQHTFHHETCLNEYKIIKYSREEMPYGA